MTDRTPWEFITDPTVNIGVCLFSLLWMSPVNTLVDTYENKANIKFYPSGESTDMQQEESNEPEQSLPNTGEKKQSEIFLGVLFLSSGVFIMVKRVIKKE
ncbi:LPXTG cell wall anchor domain-containing protein [Enterococcus faecium]